MSNQSLLYSIIKIWVRIGLSAYFKRIAIVGLEQVPKEGPLIITPNHQNAFLDALAVAAYLGRPVFFITRSDVFANPLANRFFRALNMMPIYRRRDKVDTIEMNKPIFEATAKILGNSGAIIIFPEGNQERKFNLRPLQKGFARMAFGAAMLKTPPFNIQISPVGIQYGNHLLARHDLLVQIGPPLQLHRFFEPYNQNQQQALKTLADNLALQMQRLILHIPPTEFYHTIDYLRTLYRPVYLMRQNQTPSVENCHRAEQKIVAALDNLQQQQPAQMEKLSELAFRFQQLNRPPALSPETLAKPPMFGFGLLVQLIMLLLLVPVAVWGLINHLPALLLPQIMTKRFVKDLNFFASVKFLAALCSFTLLYVLQTGLVWLLSGSFLWAFLYLFSLPLSGRIALFCKDVFMQCKQYLQCRRLNQTDKGKELVNTYGEITDMLNHLIT